MNKRATLELDGEHYEEHQAYDPLMLTKMWGYSLVNRDEISRIRNAHEEVAALFEKHLINEGQTVLVGGVQEGSHLFAFRERGVKTIGIEKNQETQDVLKVLGGGDLIFHPDFCNLPFENEIFDVVFFHSSLFMNENTTLNREEVKEIRRLLKKEGLAIIEGANGVYWEPTRKKAGDLYEFSSVEEGLWELKKEPSLAKWQRNKNFLWLEFFFITVNTEQLRVNHAYHFVPQQEGIPIARYYHEVVNYEPFEYRLKLLSEEGFVNRQNQTLVFADVYEDYQLHIPFDPQTSPGGIIVAKKG